MNVDEVFLKELYTDFSRKSTSIDTYLSKLKEGNQEINAKSIALVEALKEKYRILSEFRSKKMKVNPATSFSVDSTFDREALESADDSIQVIDQKIEQIKKSLNFQFAKLKDELKASETLFNKLANGVNEIYDTWIGIIETKE